MVKARLFGTGQSVDRGRSVILATLASCLLVGFPGAKALAADSLPPPPTVEDEGLVEPEALPDKLTFDQVLDLPLENQYGVVGARARYERRRAEHEL
ncbi:MAG: hypothetical protein ACOCPR_03065, partial [Guyparkeria sp.]